MITLNNIKKELIDSIETDRVIKNFRKLNESNAIMFELNRIKSGSFIDSLLMFDHNFYKVLKPEHKNEKRLQAILDQHPSFFKELKLDATVSQEFVAKLVTSGNNYFDFDNAHDSIKENIYILSKVLDVKKVYLSPKVEKLVKNDIELYTKYISHIYSHQYLNNDTIQFRWKQLAFWSKTFHGTGKPLLKKTENLEYFLKNYKGFYSRELIVLMCSNQTFKEKISTILDVANLPDAVVDYFPQIREVMLVEKIKEHDKAIKKEEVPITVRRKI